MALALALWLAGSFVWISVAPASDPFANVSNDAPVLDVVVNRNLPSIEHYKRHIGSWELFKASRYARPTGTVARIGVKKMAEAYEVVGIMRSGRQYRAFVKKRNNGNTSLCSAGDKLGDLVITDVTPGKVMVEFGGQAVNLIR